MKLIDLFENTSYSLEQRFIITCWGKLLYLDYFDLPQGKSTIGTRALADLIDDFNEADGDDLDALDEWISEGAPMKNGTPILSKTTVDNLLRTCQHKAGKPMTLYRFDHTANELKPNAWISLTKRDEGYSGTRSSYAIGPDDLIIDTQGLADPGEVIMNTNVLIGLK